MLGKSVKIASLLMLLAALGAAQTVPAGTRLTVRVGSELSSGTAKVGQKFDASLSRDLVVDGKTLAKAGTPVKGKVTYVKSSGRLHEPGELTLRLTSMELNGKMTPISTSWLSRQRQEPHQEQRHQDRRRRRGRRADWWTRRRR